MICACMSGVCGVRVCVVFVSCEHKHVCVHVCCVAVCLCCMCVCVYVLCVLCGVCVIDVCVHACCVYVVCVCVCVARVYVVCVLCGVCVCGARVFKKQDNSTSSPPSQGRCGFPLFGPDRGAPGAAAGL